MAYNLGQRSINDLQKIVRATERLRDSVQGQGKRNAAGRVASMILEQARANCPVGRREHPGTPHLRDTLGVRNYEDTPAKVSFGIGTDDVRGIYVEKGVSVPEIVPVNKRALWWPGLPHPVARVRAHRVPPHPFLRPAVEQTQPQWGAAVRDAIGAADPGAAMRATFEPGRGA